MILHASVPQKAEHSNPAVQCSSCDAKLWPGNPANPWPHAHRVTQQGGERLSPMPLLRASHKGAPHAIVDDHCVLVLH